MNARREQEEENVWSCPLGSWWHWRTLVSRKNVASAGRLYLFEWKLTDDRERAISRDVLDAMKERKREKSTEICCRGTYKQK